MIARVLMANRFRGFPLVSLAAITALVACGGGNHATFVLGSSSSFVSVSQAVSLNGESFYATQVHVHDETSYSCSDSVGSIDIEIAFSREGNSKRAVRRHLYS